MSTVDGGVVAASTVLRGAEPRVAVRGVWSGGRWAPTDDLLIQQYRLREVVGLWRVVGVEVTTALGNDAVLILAPRASASHPDLLRGDVLIFGEGTYSTVALSGGSARSSDDVAVVLRDGDLKGVLQFAAGAPRSLVVFHRETDTIERAQTISVRWRDEEIILGAESLVEAAGYCFEFYFADSMIPLDLLLRATGPVRDFVLDAGQEMLFRTLRPKGGIRRKETYALFEPQVAAAVGSLRLQVAAPRPAQIPLLVRPEDPLKLLVAVLRRAQEGDAGAVTRLLLGQVFSVNELLREVLRLANTAARYGALTLRVPDEPELVVSGDIVPVVKSSLQSVQPRVLERQGTLFALDTDRRWCRISVTQTTGRESWTLRYSKDLRTRVEGLVPRDVRVSFRTQALADMFSGNGEMLSIDPS